MPGLTPNDSRVGRTYTWGNEVFASVTTILNALAKPALPPWAAKMCATYVCEEWQTLQPLLEQGRFKEVEALVKGAPWRARDTAADLGTYIHKICEDYLADVPIRPADLPPEASQQLGHFLRFLDVFKPRIIESEVTVFNLTHRFAGTLDLLAEVDDKVWVIDFKTGKGVYPEMAMQVAAYSRGEFIGRKDGSEGEMPKVDLGGILHIRPGFYAFHPVDIGDDVWRSFLYCIEMFRFIQDIGPTVIQGELRR